MKIVNERVFMVIFLDIRENIYYHFGEPVDRIDNLIV